jgi:hypothetical protein
MVAVRVAIGLKAAFLPLRLTLASNMRCIKHLEKANPQKLEINRGFVKKLSYPHQI